MRSLLVMALYPNIAYFTGKRKVLTLEQSGALINKYSVLVPMNNRQDVDLPSPLLVFTEKVRTRCISCKGMSIISALQLLVFGGRKVECIGENLVRIDDMITIRMSVKAAVALAALRPCIEALLVKSCENPESLRMMDPADAELRQIVRDISSEDFYTCAGPLKDSLLTDTAVSRSDLFLSPKRYTFSWLSNLKPHRPDWEITPAGVLLTVCCKRNTKILFVSLQVHHSLVIVRTPVVLTLLTTVTTSVIRFLQQVIPHDPAHVTASLLAVFQDNHCNCKFLFFLQQLAVRCTLRAATDVAATPMHIVPNLHLLPGWVITISTQVAVLTNGTADRRAVVATEETSEEEVTGADVEELAEEDGTLRLGEIWLWICNLLFLLFSCPTG